MAHFIILTMFHLDAGPQAGFFLNTLPIQLLFFIKTINVNKWISCYSLSQRLQPKRQGLLFYAQLSDKPFEEGSPLGAKKILQPFFLLTSLKLN